MNNLYRITESYILNRTLAKVLFIIVTMLISIPYIGSRTNFLIIAIIAYGFLVLGYELITGKLLRILRSTKTTMLLIGFIFSYIITVLINKTHYLSGFKSIGFMLLLFTLFFLFPDDITKKDIIKEIKIVSATVVSLTFVFSFISFILYVFNISGTYTTNNGSYEAYYGLFDSRLWGLYNPNTGATYTIISIVLSLAFVFAYKKKRIRIPVLFNIFIQFSVLLLTGSRAGLYTLAGATAFYAFFAVIYKCKKFNIKVALISVGSAALSLILFFTGGFWLKEGLAYVPSITNYVTTITTAPEEEYLDPNDPNFDPEYPYGENELPEINKIDLNRQDVSNSPENSFFANRLSIWEASFKEFLKQPILGVGRNNIVERATEDLGNEGWIYFFKHGNTHNIYLCVLVSSGIIGFLLMGSFAGIVVLRSIKTLSKTFKKVNIWFLTSFVICIMLFANEFVESRILYKISAFGVIFWIYCGYLYKLSKFERIESNAMNSDENISLESEN